MNIVIANRAQRSEDSLFDVNRASA